MIDPGTVLLAGLLTLIEPPVRLDDLRQFPPASVCSEAMQANALAIDRIRQRESIEPRLALHWYEARCEATVAREAWRLVAEARGEGAMDEVRLEALATLRGLLGFRAYYAGALPCPVPLWRFPRAD